MKVYIVKDIWHTHENLGVFDNRADAEEFVLTESYYRALKEAHIYNIWTHYIPKSYNFTYPMIYSMHAYSSEIEIEEWEI